MSLSFIVGGFLCDVGTTLIRIGGKLKSLVVCVSLGCTIGRGISGISTLALGSIVTFGAIVARAAVTMKYQYWKIMQEDATPQARPQPRRSGASS